MQLYFQAHGQGEPLVILHGLFGSSDNWSSITPKLADRLHVFAVDLRNHGRSGHDPRMSFSLMAGDLGEFLRGQQIERANVLGHSLGGKVAMQFASSFPQRVKRLIIVDIAPRSYPPNHRTILAALMGLDLAAYTTRKEIEEALAPDIPDLSLRRFLLKNLARDSDGRFQWRMGLAEINQNYDRLCEGLDSEAHYHGPALFIRGENSGYLTPADQPEIQRRFSRAVLKTIPRSEHLVHVENPSAFLEATLNFLRSTAENVH